jgi:hypothetical protein
MPRFDDVFPTAFTIDIRRRGSVVNQEEITMIDTEIPYPGPATPAPARPLSAWYVEGARTALFAAPRWHGLRAGAQAIAVLAVIDLLLSIVLQRFYIDGPATFYWQAVSGGWFSTAVIAWLCLLLREDGSQEAPGARQLFAMVLAQASVISLAAGVLYILMMRAGLYNQRTLGMPGLWAVWLAPGIWMALAQVVLLARSGSRRSLTLASSLMVIALTALLYAERPPTYWYAAENNDAAGAPPRLRLTQDMMEAQPQLLMRQLQALKAERPGVIDFYTIAFAPYSAPVFRRESDMVDQVMQRRFDGAGRGMQLVNSPDTVATRPWATPRNLQRAIARAGELMNRDEDILFLHLTSHGAVNGELAADFWPLDVATVKPADLRTWLDDAGIRNRVISISACYSGSWIGKLADEDTLVMTASDAEHTSYGCGSKSELTFFGRAMYDEQLRNRTLSFEQAHAAARDVIRQREKEAGKDDGYSNPQIRMGGAIRERLRRLQAQLEAGVK